MKSNKILMILILFLSFTSCSSNDEDNPNNELANKNQCVMSFENLIRGQFHKASVKTITVASFSIDNNSWVYDNETFESKVIDEFTADYSYGTSTKISEGKTIVNTLVIENSKLAKIFSDNNIYIYIYSKDYAYKIINLNASTGTKRSTTSIYMDHSYQTTKYVMQSLTNAAENVTHEYSLPNKYGDYTKLISSDEGNILNTATIEYSQYDRFGNWTVKKMTTIPASNDGDNEQISYNLEKRTIEYYN